MQSMQTLTIEREARLTLAQEASLALEVLKRFDKLTLDDEASLTLERESEARYTAPVHTVWRVKNAKDFNSLWFFKYAEDFT